MDPKQAGTGGVGSLSEVAFESVQGRNFDVSLLLRASLFHTELLYIQYSCLCKCFYLLKLNAFYETLTREMNLIPLTIYTFIIAFLSWSKPPNPRSSLRSNLLYSQLTKCPIRLCMSSHQLSRLVRTILTYGSPRRAVVVGLKINSIA